jgi:hypothetical protein
MVLQKRNIFFLDPCIFGAGVIDGCCQRQIQHKGDKENDKKSFIHIVRLTSIND